VILRQPWPIYFPRKFDGEKINRVVAQLLLLDYHGGHEYTNG
jgi:hypothetical protein